MNMIDMIRGVWKRLNPDSARSVYLSKCPYDLKPLGYFDGMGNIIIESGAGISACHKCRKLFKITYNPKGYRAFVRIELINDDEILRFRKGMTDEESKEFIKKIKKDLMKKFKKEYTELIKYD